MPSAHPFGVSVLTRHVTHVPDCRTDVFISSGRSDFERVRA